MSTDATIPCPGCGAQLILPSGANTQSIRCPKCDFEVQLGSGTESPSSAAANPELEAAPIPSHLRPRTEGSTGSPPPAPTVGGFQIAIPDEDTKRYRTKSSKAGMIGMIVAALSLMLLSSATVAALALRMWYPEWFAPPVQEDQVGVIYLKGTYKRPTQWTEGATSSIRVAGLRVKVERIEIGPVVAKAGDLEIVKSDNDVIQIYLSLENEFDESIDYISWYGNEFQVGDTTVVARLTAGNVELHQLVFEDAAGVYGHVPQATIHPKATIQDSIVFELPNNPEARKGPWKLELPQAAFGYPASVGFELDERLVRKGSILGTPGSAFEGDNEMDDDK